MMPTQVNGLLKTLLILGGGDSNLYGYVLGDPVNFVDPDGRIAWVPILLGIYLLSNTADTLIIPAVIRPAITRTLTREAVSRVPWTAMAARGNVADTAITQALLKEGTGGKSRCDWLKDNAGRFPKKAVKMTEKAWGCRHSRASKDNCKK